MMQERKLVVEMIDDPVLCAEARKRDEQFKRNLDWIQNHWQDIPPEAVGKFLVVAGCEPHVAETAAEAFRWAETVHPEDPTPFIQYLSPHKGPRIYALRAAGEE